MPRTVPSQIVELIDETFPTAAKEEDTRPGQEHAPVLAGIVRLAQEIPEELLQISGADYTDFVVGLVGLDHAVKLWESHGNATVPWKIGGASYIVRIRRALAKCPDESPPPQTVKLEFIDDEELKSSIRVDIAGADHSLHNGEWKSSTILAGSALEALLLWAVKSRKSEDEVATAIDGTINSKKLTRPPDSEPEKWNLHQFIEVGLELQLIEETSAIQARLAQNFRNLIHPGRTLRLNQVCDRATALSALAAVEHVVRDLS